MRKAVPLSAAFAKLIRKYRKERGLSQEALGESARLHHTYVSLLERGKNVPTIDAADRISRALGMKLSQLIAEAE